MQEKKKPILEYLPDNFNAQLSKAIYTSGKDGILFSGIPVGEVFEGKKNNRIEAKLFADPDQISLINVILGKSSDLEAM